MNKPLVSIIIPVYNAAAYIAETINSAISQTWENKEIIIVDDGSTDGSLAIVKKYENDSIKVFTQQNKGAGAARNTGLSRATGEYIQFLDADDLLSTNKIESQIDQLINSPGYLALCATVHFQNGTPPTDQPVQHDWYAEGSNDPADFLIKLYGGALIGPVYGGMIQPNAWLTPKNIVDKAGPWNEMRNPDDDGEFFCRIVLASKGIVYADDAINYYRKFNTGNSLSGQKKFEYAAGILKSTDLKASYLLSHTNRKEAKLALCRLYYENAVSFYPQYKSLAREAEKKAMVMAPLFNFNPYYKGFLFTLSKILGWKGVRYLQYLKIQITNKG
jgi:glycosyltransferase involved in cell wall biosynthesis